MTKEEPAGYLGAAQLTLKSAGVKVGDRVSIVTVQTTFEGIIIPRAEIGADDQHIILKLDSGYNVGIHVDNIKELKRQRSFSNTCFPIDTYCFCYWFSFKYFF